GDFGAGVATFMALDDPQPMLGVHLSTLEIPPYTGPGSRPLSDAERAYLAAMRRWEQTEGGYKAIQSTKPQTLGYGLNDSPAGLAAWILEKWRSWADSGGDPMARLPRDSLLTMLTIYWATQTITPSMRDYLDNRWHGVAPGPTDFVEVPTAVAVFANHFIPEGDPPREWAERLYTISPRTPPPTPGRTPPAGGPNPCPTPAGGPRCPAAATSLPQRSRTASPATSPPSSRRSEPNSHRVQAGNP